MFVVKHQVRSLEGELARTEREIVGEQETIHVLAAEWSYLNQPARLDRLGRRLIRLVAMTAAHQTDLAGLRLALAAPMAGDAPRAPPSSRGYRVDAAASPGDRP
jgi:hypothetical protein